MYSVLHKEADGYDPLMKWISYFLTVGTKCLWYSIILFWDWYCSTGNGINLSVQGFRVYGQSDVKVLS